MILASPPSYVTAATFLAQATDYDFSSYSNSEIQDALNMASGKVNAIIRRNLLAREITEEFFGNGSRSLNLGVFPIIYVKQMQFVQPGLQGFTIPLNRVIVDSLKGTIEQYSPLVLQGVGYVSVFPEGTPVAITYASGYGYGPLPMPVYTTADNLYAPGGLTPGTYLIGITSRAQWGETLPTYSIVTTALGSIIVTLAPQLGVWKYRAFASRATTLTAAASIGATSVAVASPAPFAVGQAVLLEPGAAAQEQVTVTAIVGSAVGITATTKSHASGAAIAPVPSLVTDIAATTFGGTPVAGTISSLTLADGYYPELVPVADTSAIATPPEIVEAVRLLTLSRFYEQNNLSNRGVATTRSGSKSIAWRSTEGTNAKGIPLMEQQASELLAGFKLTVPL